MNTQYRRDLPGWCIHYHLERPTVAVCMLERLRVWSLLSLQSQMLKSQTSDEGVEDSLEAEL